MDFDQSLYDDIEELVATLQLAQDEPAYGIAQQVIHEGYDKLSDKQRHVYDSVVIPALDALHQERERNRFDSILSDRS